MCFGDVFRAIVGGWGIALLLGGSSMLRAAGPEIIAMGLALYAAAIVVAVATAVRVGHGDPDRNRRLDCAENSAAGWSPSDTLDGVYDNSAREQDDH